MSGYRLRMYLVLAEEIQIEDVTIPKSSRQILSYAKIFV